MNLPHIYVTTMREADDWRRVHCFVDENVEAHEIKGADCWCEPHICLYAVGGEIVRFFYHSLVKVTYGPR